MSSLFGRGGVHTSTGADRTHETWTREGGLLVVLGLFWVVSLIRVVGALVRGEVFGVEATLAFIAVLTVPWLAWGSRGTGRQRLRAHSNNEEVIRRVHLEAARAALERGDTPVAIGHCRAVLEGTGDAVVRRDAVRLLAYAYATGGRWGQLMDLIESGAPIDLGDGDLERYERAARELGRARDALRIASLRAQRAGA